MAQKSEYFVMLSPLDRLARPVRLRPTDSDKYIFEMFAPGEIKEIDERGFEDLRKYNINAKWTSREANEGTELGLTHMRTKGCGGCAKKRKLDPNLVRNFVFRKFVEVDPKTKELLSSELKGEVTSSEYTKI